mmetsp:Transcript_19165/g.53242  ORF Transcript_19165/g.53242 Transcript_19165/m.53242 type:complete len:81 (-) Transcript_19165:240-482(-)
MFDTVSARDLVLCRVAMARPSGKGGMTGPVLLSMVENLGNARFCDWVVFVDPDCCVCRDDRRTGKDGKQSNMEGMAVVVE